MSLRLGNLSVDDLERRLGVSLSESDRQFLEAARQNTAHVEEPDKLHIFDMPFSIICGSEELSKKVLAILLPHSGKVNETIEIGHVEEV